MGWPKTHAGAGVLAGDVEDFLGGADLVGGQNRQRFVQRRFQSRPAGAARAEQVVGADDDIVEPHFGDGNKEADVRRDGDAGAFGVDQQENHFAFFRARGAEKARRGFGVEDKALGAVHQVAVGSLAKPRFNRLRSPIGGFVRRARARRSTRRCTAAAATPFFARRCRLRKSSER